MLNIFNNHRELDPGSRIFLIGFMGVGKTYLGERLAHELNLPFYDLDLEIENQVGMSIPEIFSRYGEHYFRQIETELLQNWDMPGIIASGGGIVEARKNRDLLSNAMTVWLHPGWDVIKSRILNSDRPLVRQLGEDGLYKLWQRRQPLYQQSSKLVYSGNDVNELLKLIFSV